MRRENVFRYFDLNLAKLFASLTTLRKDSPAPCGRRLPQTKRQSEMVEAAIGCCANRALRDDKRTGLEDRCQVFFIRMSNAALKIYGYGELVINSRLRDYPRAASGAATR